MNKKTLAFLSVLFILIGMPASLFSLTKSEDLSKFITYPMGYATNLMDTKEMDAAMKKLIAEDLIFDLLDLNAQTFLDLPPDKITGLKGKLSHYKTVYDSVSNGATALGAGKYDDAAIAATDALVSSVNHPLITMTWAAAKLTYESHKAVVETGAALDVERLYSIVNKDRKLVGVDPGGDNPPLITVDSNTVDYFYNKYVITNSSVRALMKSYVQSVMKEEWPELSLTDKLWGNLVLGTGQSAQDVHEVTAISNFKNDARRWVRHLLMDLNKQVVVEWRKTRLRQQVEFFNVERTKFHNGFNNFSDMVATYQLVRNAKDQQKNFGKVSKEIEETMQKAGELEKKDIMGARGLYYKAFREATAWRAVAIHAGDASYQAQFEKIESASSQKIGAIDKKIEGNMASLAHKEAKDSYKGANSYFSEFYQQYTSIIDSFDTFSLPKAPFTDVMNALQANDLSRARQIVGDWERERRSVYNSEKYNEAKAEIDKIKKNYPEECKKNPEDTPEEKKKKEEIAEAWDAAASAAGGAIDKIAAAKNNLYVADIGRMADMCNYYYELGKVAGKVFSRISFGTFWEDMGIATQKGKGWLLHQFPAEADIPKTISVYKSSDVLDLVKADSYLAMKPVKEMEGGWSKHIDASIDYALMRRMGELESIRDRYLNYEWHALKIPTSLEKIKATKEMWMQLAPDITEEYVSTHFSASDTAAFMKIKDKTTKMFESFDPEKEGKKKSGEISKLLTTNITNVTNDIDYLNNLRLELKRWANDQKAIDLADMQPGEETGMYCRSVGGSKTWATKKPYPHLMRKKEFQENPMMVQAKRDFENLALYGYMKKNMPKTLQNLQDVFSAKQCAFVTEDNIIINGIVWDSTMKKAEGILNSMSVNDPLFFRKVKEIQSLIVDTVRFPQRNEADGYYSVSGTLAPLPPGMDLDAIAGLNSVAKRYRDFRQKLGDLMEAYAKKFHDGPTQEEIDAGQRRRQYGESYQTAKKRFGQLSNPHPDTTPSRNYQSMKALYDSFMTMKKTYDADTLAKLPDLTKKIEDLAKEMAAKLEEFRAAAASYEARTGKEEAQIREFYNTFKKNYEDKRENRLIAVLDDRWQAQDGSTIEDVEDHFRNMFTLYNVIRYEISGMLVEPHRKNKNEYYVSYTLVIKGENYDMGIKREEKSDVNELVRIDGSGKIKVIQTIDGRFYYIN